MNRQDYFRTTSLLGFVFVVLLLFIALYLQFYQHVLPCPLCELQRFIMAALGIIFILGTASRLKAWAKKVLNASALMFSIIGIIFSARQVWIQHVPPAGLGECGINLSYIFKIFSFFDALKHVWAGGTECTQQGWVFLNLSLAEWSLIAFVFFFFLIIAQQRFIK